AAPDPECPTCGLGQYTTLDAENAAQPAMLCGRDAVQISSPAGTQLDLAALAERLRPLGEVKVNEYLVRFSVGEYELTIFRDARAIIKGVDDIALARSLYARYVGA
ncbi:MAG: thiazole biosynthesis adenylyltransferase ThiF, partial [Pyrinomonadaceae bacterium]